MRAGRGAIEGTNSRLFPRPPKQSGISIEYNCVLNASELSGDYFLQLYNLTSLFFPHVPMKGTNVLLIEFHAFLHFSLLSGSWIHFPKGNSKKQKTYGCSVK